MKASDASLVNELQKGNGTHAFAKIFEQYYRALCAFSQSLVDDVQDAQDITGDVFFKLWAIRADFESMHQIKAYLYKTTRNASLNFIRDKGRRLSHEKRGTSQLYSEFEPEVNFLERAELEQAKIEVLEEFYIRIERMPAMRKKVFKLLFKLGMENKEVSEILKTSMKSVRNQKSRGIKQLRMIIPQLNNNELLRLLLNSNN